MKEFIERASVHSIIEQTSTLTFTRGGMHEQIDSLPAADVVEVVRCRECKHGKCGVDNMVRCSHPCGKVISMTAGDFCSYGQRKIETVLPKSDAKDESLEADHEVSEPGYGGSVYRDC